MIQWLFNYSSFFFFYIENLCAYLSFFKKKSVPITSDCVRNYSQQIIIASPLAVRCSNFSALCMYYHSIYYRKKKRFLDVTRSLLCRKIIRGVSNNMIVFSGGGIDYKVKVFASYYIKVAAFFAR